MKIFVIGQGGDLEQYGGKSIVVQFQNGGSIELDESERPLPEEVPEGIQIWGGRVPSRATTDMKYSQLSITPVASNGIVLSPFDGNAVSDIEMLMFISDDDGHLRPVQGKKVVIELRNGKTLEVLEDYAKKGLLVWGGREPTPNLPLERIKEITARLGIYPMASNFVHIFPFKLE